MKTSSAAICSLRAAKRKDVAAICEIVNSWADRGKMLARKPKEVLGTLRDFVVFECEGQVIACGALSFYGPDLAELRSIAVSSNFLDKGYGREIVDYLVKRAKRRSAARVFAFTYVPGFFKKLGFHIVDPASLPQKAWRDCRFCSKREGCDEIAMLQVLE